jgi:dethiobiotin synthetase
MKQFPRMENQAIIGQGAIVQALSGAVLYSAAHGEQRIVTAWFVTATGTDVGKTYVTAGLLGQARRSGRGARAIKPVMSGFDPNALAQCDAGVLLAAMGESVAEDAVARISPWRFVAPLSPDMAAAREGRSLDFAALVAFCRAQTERPFFIEGVGGVMVPLTETHTVLDWMAALGLPLVLVTGSYLGSLSHTLTAVDTCLRRGLKIAALILNESFESPVSLEDTEMTLRRFVRPSSVVTLRRPAGEAVFAELWELLSNQSR